MKYEVKYTDWYISEVEADSVEEAIQLASYGSHKDSGETYEVTKKQK
jgi:hypothetical protein